VLTLLLPVQQLRRHLPLPVLLVLLVLTMMTMMMMMMMMDVLLRASFHDITRLS
jgi:hypothetical protein